tara:strand:- start:3661 stop:4788 length:1128 start_codon:yes stop_codon:yes gene_type:complete
MIRLIMSLYSKVINIILFIRNINIINSAKPKYIFYSENRSYQKYSYLLIKLLAKKNTDRIFYVSSDINDKIEDLNVKNMFIGKGFFMQYFFNIVKSENMFLTITDLDNHVIKKTKNVNNYIYYFHSAVSTSIQYTNKAFDNYDTILCNGEYQLKEIKRGEFLKNNKKKKLIKSGYLYFDYLKKKINLQKISNEVLIAPSWNSNEVNFMNQNLELLIDEVLKKGFNVRFRPHPENFKRSPNIIEGFRKKFMNSNFILDDNVENKEAMENAKCLITDNSGIAIEYILLFKKPVLYFEDVRKVHNLNFKEYDDLITMEDKVKNTFGYIFKKNEIKDIDLIINNSIKDFKNKDNIIEKFTNENFYNFGLTVENLDQVFN